MKIGIDVHFAAKNKRGIGNYCYHLLKNLMDIDQDNDYILYLHKDDMLDLPLKDNFIIKNLPTNNYVLYEQFYLPTEAKKDKVNILHSLGNTGPILLSKKIQLIVTLHDVMFMKKNLRLKNMYQKLGRIYRKLVVYFIIKSAKKIISVSEFSRLDILKTFRLKDPEKVYTVLESYDNNVYFPKKKSIQIENRFILALGAMDPRKNTALILKVFSKLRKKHDLRLTITGLSDESFEYYMAICVKLNIVEYVDFLGFVSEEELATLYSSAFLFLYPSTYEGFGIPPLEAMACECPVVTSNVTAIPEIVGKAAILVNPHSEKEILDACLTILENNLMRESQIRLGVERVKHFSWRKTALETLKIYTLGSNQLSNDENGNNYGNNRTRWSISS